MHSNLLRRETQVWAKSSMGKWMKLEDKQSNEVKLSEWWELLRVLPPFPAPPAVSLSTNPQFFSEPTGILENRRFGRGGEWDPRREVWEKWIGRKRGTCLWGTKLMSPKKWMGVKWSAILGLPSFWPQVLRTRYGLKSLHYELLPALSMLGCSALRTNWMSKNPLLRVKENAFLGNLSS